MRRIGLLSVLWIFLLAGCSDGNGKLFPVDEEDLPQVEVKVHRYGKALFEADTSRLQTELQRLQGEFGLFLGRAPLSTEGVQQIHDFVTDTQLLFVARKTLEVYPDLDRLETRLADAFARYRYFFPDQQTPAVYTYISDIYFEEPVMTTDTAVIIALDVYLGSDFPFYLQLGLPRYKVRCMEPDNLPVDVMKTLYIKNLAPDYKRRTLLDRMIDGGKMLVFLDAVLPDVPDTLKICYTAKKLDWALQNEKSIWAFLVSNDLLYATDYQTQSKLIQDAPFTTGFSNESPARLGIFIGWQIVKDYVKRHPDVPLDRLIRMTDSQKILQESGYKP